MVNMRHFGVALGRMGAGNSGQIAVKVHFDPLDDTGLLHGDATYPQTGENLRSPFASYTQFDTADGVVFGSHHHVMWNDDAGNLSGACIGVRGVVGVEDGATMGGASIMPLMGVEGTITVTGTIDNVMTCIAGTKGVIHGAGTVTNVTDIFAVCAQNLCDLSATTGVGIALLGLRNDAIAHNMHSVFYVWGANGFTHLFDFGTAPTGTWIDAAAHGDTDGGRLSVLDNGVQKYIYMYTD